MQLQKQSKLFNHFQGELPNFPLIRYATVAVTERRNIGLENNGLENLTAIKGFSMESLCYSGCLNFR